LGHAGMSQWAIRAEEHAGRAFKQQEPQARSRKKKR
jgi:hypothetical protein